MRVTRPHLRFLPQTKNGSAISSLCARDYGKCPTADYRWTYMEAPLWETACW